MKKTVFTAALAFGLFTTSLHAQDLISGKWDASVVGPQGPMEMSFKLKAGAAGAVTGSMSVSMMPGTEMPISDGMLKGKDVSFKIVMPAPPGAPGGMTLDLTGKVDGDSLTLLPVMPAGAPAGAPAPQPLVAKRAAAAK